MEERITYLLLKALRDDANISNLEKAGYDYVSIASQYSKLINDQFIIPNEDLQFVLSKKGVEEMKRLEEKIIRAGNWKIEPYVKHKIKRMNKYEIFLE